MVVDALGTELEDMTGSYTRLPQAALRVATLLAGITGHSQITLPHWVRAQTIAERWREALHNLQASIGDDGLVPAERKAEDKIARVLGKHGPSTINQISKFIRNIAKADLERICHNLTILGVLDDSQRTQKNTKIYKLNESL
jgi:D-mannonate dehydratase